MEVPELVMMFPCGCGSGIPMCYHADQVGHVVRCPHIDREMHVIGSPFGVAEWETTSRPSMLQACTDLLGIKLSPRKLRLSVCNWSRGNLKVMSNDWDWGAVSFGEEWAETGVKPSGVEALLRRREAEQRGGHHGHFCIEEIPSLPPSDQFSDPSAPASDCFRDVTPNPFVPLEWQPEWFTSTVHALATHIYVNRDFSTMPILGDALMDAGCDHQLIHDHCRSEKPHARGCWVVDAILGKT